jgi:gamma-glutamyltranspeptidase/glutathione hydrolase
VRDAVDAPRLHWDEGTVHAEGGLPAAEIDSFEEAGFAVTRWPRKDLFFGGAQAVELLEDGTLAAAGDPRRGGAGIVVE